MPEIKSIALDIGGTNTRIALISFEKEKNSEGHRFRFKKILKRENYQTKNVKSLGNKINNFVQKNDLSKEIEEGKISRDICIGFAGPIKEDNDGSKSAELTNANLKINTNILKKETGFDNVYLVNDFHANGYAIHFLEKKDLFLLSKNKSDGFVKQKNLKENKAPKKEENIKMVVGPGTGLGKAYVIGKKVYPCESGLTILGIENKEEYDLLEYLNKKYETVYYEDIISGRGLIDIYDYLIINNKNEVNPKIREEIDNEPFKKAEIITKYSKKDKICDLTLKTFTRFYARFVRDCGLHLISSEIYLIGGISTSIKPYLQKHFMEEFLKHRKYVNLLKAMKVYLVLTNDVGILGSGVKAAGLVE